jgi:hypothetical protein
MTSPRDHRRRSDLSDTGRELLAILEDEVERIRAERHTPVTSFPATNESSEHLRSMAGEVADGRVTTHKLHCLLPGGVLHSVTEKMEKRMETVEKVQKDHHDFINQYLGEKRFKRFVMPILIGFLGSSAGAALMALLFRTLASTLIHDALSGVVKP